MIFRAEHARDREAVFALHAANFPTADEARLVDALRAGGWLIGGFVAEMEQRIVGHVAFSRLTAGGAPALSLAPVSVAPRWRRRGVGAGLITHAHGELAARSERMSFVLGDPAYYARFGYRAALAARYPCAYAGPAFQAIVLTEEALPDGEIVYPPPFAML